MRTTAIKQYKIQERISAERRAKPKTTKSYKHTEYAAQVAVFQWAAYNMRKYPQLKWLHSSQDGVHTTFLAAKRAVAAGMKRGIPDLNLPFKTAKYAGLYIEMKIKPNKVTKLQQEWIDYLNTQGYFAVVCYSSHEAIDIITEYLQT